ncbi:MAG: AAA family ATPase [Gemmatirosa sp.]
MSHLLQLRCTLPTGAGADAYPFTVPAVRALAALPDGLALDAPVTCFVGENGSGKSTLLEGLAAASGVPTVGSDEVAHDPTLGPARALAKRLRLGWRVRTTRGFFLRAEDFFGFARRLARLRAELEARVVEVKEEYAATDRSAWATGLALGPLQGSIADMERRYGADPDARSHGESFLALFQSRLVPKGLYLLDEPEAALSPQRQLALLSMIRQSVQEGSQFVLATHSPLLLAYPGARLYSFDDGAPSAVAWDALEHVRLTRDFLAAPERFLRHL